MIWELSKVGPETRNSHKTRTESGFFGKYFAGDVILDIGYSGGKADACPILSKAVGIDLDYSGYDGLHLPFNDGSVDTVYSSHCLEHMINPSDVICEWYRVLKIGGFMVIAVPHMWLYEKKLSPPSLYNTGHIRFYTPGRLMNEVEDALEPNSYRVRELRDVDEGYDYSVPPELHAGGRYEIEMVLEKIIQPLWSVGL
jgi:SAM-dependent methyltransferase